MAFAATGNKAKQIGSAAGSLSVPLTGTTAGNLVVVCTVSSGSTSPAAVVTDGGNTWTSLLSYVVGTTTLRELAFAYSVLGTGGTRTITSDPGSSTYDMGLFAQEFTFTAGRTIVTAGTAATNSALTNTTPGDSTAFTPLQGREALLYLGGVNVFGNATITENVSPGDTNWTLSNENEDGVNGQAGSFVYFLATSSNATRRAAWTLGTNSGYAAAVCALSYTQTVSSTVGLASSLNTSLGGQSLAIGSNISL